PANSEGRAVRLGYARSCRRPWRDAPKRKRRPGPVFRRNEIGIRRRLVPAPHRSAERWRGRRRTAWKAPCSVRGSGQRELEDGKTPLAPEVLLIKTQQMRSVRRNLSGEGGNIGVMEPEGGLAE